MKKYERVPVRTLAKTFFRELAFVFKIAPRESILLTFLQVLIGVMPPISLFLGAKIIDLLIHPIRVGFWSPQLFWYITASLVVLGFQRFIFSITDYYSNHLRGFLQVAVNDRINRMIASLDLPSLETPSIHTLISYLKDQQWRPHTMVSTLFQLTGNIIASVSYIVLAATFSPIYTVLFLIAVIPSLVISVWATYAGQQIAWGKASMMKQVWYFESLFRRTRTLVELMIHHVGAHFADRYLETYRGVIQKENEIEKHQLIGKMAANIGAFAVYVLVYLRVIQSVVTQSITVGQFTLYIGAFIGLERFLVSQAWQITQLFEHTKYLDSFRELEQIVPSIRDAKRAQILSSIETIELQTVSYQYPNSKAFALKDVSLLLHKGERVAIVGENGAGKSTLVKLLMRLYEATHGIILINGIDYRKFTLESLRKQIGVTFQDFEKYSLTVRENIGIGEATQLQNLSVIQSAAERAGIHERISKLPDGYETILGHEFADAGTELSGGEWQKLALARSLVKNASLLILDEPTAALDARSEYQFFQELFKKTREQSVIVISHRFSSVRVADRIIVLKDGHIEEEGTHDDLVHQNGLYKELYELQTKEIE